MNHLNWTCRMFCVPVTLLIASTTWAHPRFDVTDLGPTSTVTDQGSQRTIQYYSLNNAGQVVGVRLPNYDVFIWQNGTTTDLGIQGTPVKINDSGQVVVNSNSGGKVYLWQGGTITDLSATIGDDSLTALDFNNKGQILFRKSSSIYALWENGIVTPLESISNGSIFYGMNNNTEILFWSSPTSIPITQLYLWKENQITGLDITNKGYSEDWYSLFYISSYPVIRMNDSLQIVFNRTLYQNGESMKLDFAPFLLNNPGQMVGYHVGQVSTSLPSNIMLNNPIYPPFDLSFWEDGVTRKITDLIDNNSFSDIDDAKALNDNGQILAISQTGDGLIHGILLTPNGQTDTHDPGPLTWLSQLPCTPMIFLLAGGMILGFGRLGDDQ